MENWDEIRTAYFVAREGTVSRAAEYLGIHHATVIRHIDSLEARINTKLFQRHARGYTPTEAGKELLRVAQGAHDRFTQLDAFIRGRSDAVEGELIITSLVGLAPRLMPHLRSFQAEHPGVTLRYLAGTRLFRLEYGEAHVAIRAAQTAPEEPDNVVQQLCSVQTALYATRDYIDAQGMPQEADGFAGHRFVADADESSRAPYAQWMREGLGDDQVVFRSDEAQVQQAAVLSGIGLGFMSLEAAGQYPGLVQVAPPRAEWDSRLWLVTHMDLHRSAKVQAITKFLKARMGDG